MEKLNSNDLLSNFSHEAISRVIPGLVVLALYFHTYVVAALKLAQVSSILSISAIFIAAWLIGATFEKLGNYLIIPVVENILAKICGCSYCGDSVPEDARLLTYYLKYIAETQMFRAFCVISGVTVCIAPNLAFFTKVEWHWWYGCIAIAVNLYVYLCLKFQSSYQKSQCETSSCYDI